MYIYIYIYMYVYQGLTGLSPQRSADHGRVATKTRQEHKPRHMKKRKKGRGKEAVQLQL